MTNRAQILLTASIMCAMGRAEARTQGVPGPESHVRGCSGATAKEIAEAYDQSPTIRALIDALTASDVVVYVEDKPLSHLDGRLKFAGLAGEYRYVRISLQLTLRRPARIGILAHELQHAIEVATAPDVVDQRTFGDLYERIGYRASFGYETKAAQRVAKQAIDELAVDADAAVVR